MASGEEVEVLSDSEETSETEAIGDGSSTSSGKFRSDVWIQVVYLEWCIVSCEFC